MNMLDGRIEIQNVSSRRIVWLYNTSILPQHSLELLPNSAVLSVKFFSPSSPGHSLTYTFDPSLTFCLYHYYSSHHTLKDICLFICVCEVLETRNHALFIFVPSASHLVLLVEYYMHK